MGHSLYPLKFIPQYKDKVWGGQRLKKLFGKDFSPLPNCGESWEVSSVPGSVSVVANGFLAGNELTELSEIYMSDLVGEHVYDRFGNAFPLLIKLLDTNEDLSIQVHPGDDVAQLRHHSPGKTEMWYVVHAVAGARIIAGFNKDVSKEEYLHHLRNNSLTDILNVYSARSGDVFYIPAGQVHAIGAGVTLCEIQQSSDVTYRIYDWDRPGNDGKPRKLHVEEALDVIDYKAKDNFVRYKVNPGNAVTLVQSEYFTTRLLQFSKTVELDYYFVDSFVVYVCVKGACSVETPTGDEQLSAGETLLLPAITNSVILRAESGCELLETYLT